MNSVPSDSFQRIEAVFHSALERAPGEREAYVELACADSPSLCGRVLQLLRADEQDADSLSDSRITPLARSIATRPAGSDDLQGMRVGAYRLVSRLGEGGMGSVWLGERDDQEFERRVAVKVIKRGMDSEQVLKRFRVERRALGVLEHPSVARLLDAVMTPDGRPALIMEHVEGKPLDEYCASGALRVCERLELFLGVCDAVSYAHQMLVVHRDLKPSNIYVTPTGEPKLIDFGIAKILASDDTQATVTAAEQRVLTPRYASPEQVRGEPVTTATDVFSLGVVLYELLSGRAPFEAPSGSRAEIGRLVCEQDPVRPSTAVTRLDPGEQTGASPPAGTDASTSATRLRRVLEGDLDTIVLKALRKEPGRRYQSVAELGDDIRRYLDDRPVLARADTLGYRTRKFVRRNRGVVVGVSLFMGMTFAGLGTVSWMLIRTRAAEAAEVEQREIAEERFDEADSVAGFLEEMLASATPDRADGRAPEVLREILDAAEARMEQELTGQPRVRARIQHTLASSYRLVGDYEKSERHFAEAESVRRAMHEPGSFELGTTLHEYALLAMDRGDQDRARGYVTEALAVFGGDDAMPSRSVANAHDLLGVIAMEESRLGEAERHFDDAIKVYEQAGLSDDEALLQCYGKRAVLLAQTGRNADAISVLERAIERLQSSSGAPRIGQLSLLNNLAVLYRRVGREEDALAMYNRILGVSRTLLGSDHRLALVPRANRAMVLHRLGRLDEAQAEFESVYAAQVEAIGAEHVDTVTTLFNHAQLVVDLGDLPRAQAMFERALELNTAAYGPAHPNVAMSHGALGKAIARLGGPDRRSEAERHLAAARDAFSGALGEGHPATLRAGRDLEELRGELTEAPAP